MVETYVGKPQMGHFWPKGSKSSEAWTGVLQTGDFPEVEVCTLQLKKFESEDSIVYGVLDAKTIASLFECTIMPSRHEWRNFGARIDNSDIPNRQYGRRILANYMCVGTSCFEQKANIVRIHFYSKVAEDALVLWHRQKEQNHALEWVTVASRSCTSKGLRLRIQQRLDIKCDRKPACRIILSFSTPVTPKTAYSMMLKTRTLLSILCGAYVDISDAAFTKKDQGRLYVASFIFYNPPLSDTLLNDDKRAALAVTRNASLMQRVTDAWFSQSEQHDISSRIFENVLKEQDTIDFNQIKNLVTCLEMILADKTKPLNKNGFEDLKFAVQKACDQLSVAHPTQKEGYDIVRSRLDILNSINAKPKVRKAIDALGKEMASNQFADIDAFVSDSVNTRNKATHDPSRLTAIDYKRLHWLAVKLRMIVAYNLWKALAATDLDINQATPIIFRARAFGDSPPS